MVVHAAGSLPNPGTRGKREPGVSPGLPRSGEWERQPSTKHWVRRFGPGKRRSVGVDGEPSDGAPMSPKTCQRTAPAGCGGPRPRGTADGSVVTRAATITAFRHPPRSPDRLDRTREERAMTVTMQVRKRNGDTEDVDVNKIVRAVQRVADELTDVD